MNYNNGKIYVLRNYINEYFYIGSTCSPLAKRLCEHKQDLRKVNKSKTYEKMKQLNIEPRELYIELIELCPCDNVYQLRKREGEVILKMKDKYANICLNKNVSGRSFKEYYTKYYIDNREKFKEYRIKNYIQNSDILNQKVGCIVCKCMVSKKHFKRHCKSNKHLQNLSNKPC